MSHSEFGRALDYWVLICKENFHKLANILHVL